MTDHISGFQDLMATVAEAADVEIPKQCGGLSMLLLTGKPQTEHTHLSWQFQLDGWSRIMKDGGFRQLVRMGHWKAVRYGTVSKTQLYDLRTDIGESQDVAADHPDIVNKANRLFKEESKPTPGFPYGGVILDYKPKNKYNK